MGKKSRSREVKKRSMGALRVILRFSASYTKLQPLRKVGRRYLLASGWLVMRILEASYSILPSTRREMTPSSIHSTNGAALLKLEQAGSPPLQARIQSR